ncbi:MAG: hypothetical protein Q8R38_07855 [Candidatus Omnitrophota bacterium]|nr:hypothetical protein [Candidatus Omnitrophota bacterium]
MLKDGDILLCKGTDLTSKLIKWGTNSAYSHVAVAASANLGLIIEAIPQGGVRAISVENYKTPYDLYRVKDDHPYQINGVVSFLIMMLARKYDTRSATILGWKIFLRKMRLLKLLGLKIAHNKKASDSLQEDQDYFCSELCYKAFYLGGGLDIVPSVGDAETTSPGDIARSKIVHEVI